MASKNSSSVADSFWQLQHSDSVVPPAVSDQPSDFLKPMLSLDFPRRTCEMFTQVE